MYHRWKPRVAEDFEIGLLLDLITFCFFRCAEAHCSLVRCGRHFEIPLVLAKINLETVFTCFCFAFVCSRLEHCYLRALRCLAFCSRIGFPRDEKIPGFDVIEFYSHGLRSCMIPNS